MTRIQNVKVGDPMGFKVNITSEVVLDSLITSLNVYHAGKYVVGKDTAFGVTPHYHIHWFSNKIVTAGALKVFRTALGKKLTWLTRSDKLYTGQELESADPDKWISYAIKETQCEQTTMEITEQQKILAKASFENKRQNKVYSEKKQAEEKEKKDERAKMYQYVTENLPDYQSVGNDYYGDEQMAFECTVIKYKMSQFKMGCVKKHFLAQYYLEYKCHYAQEKWNELQVYKYIHNK